MTWTLHEPCCGSAALSLALLGARKPLLPYQGSKWRFRHGLVAHLASLGFEGAPDRLHLSDPGPWGRVLPTVLDPNARTALLTQLRALHDEDPRQVFDRTHKAPAPADAVAFSAQFLFLQRLSYSGKAVGLRDGCWASPGFNSSSAYGLAATDRFGKVNPMIPSLIRVLEGLDSLRPVALTGTHGPAPTPTGPVDRPTLVYLDPPYAGSTLYPNGDLSRPEVVALATAWHDAGATVVLSEGEALPELLALGWTASPLDPGRKDTSPFRGKQAEWLTTSPRP